MRPLATEVTKRAYRLGIPIVGASDFTYGRTRLKEYQHLNNSNGVWYIDLT